MLGRAVARALRNDETVGLPGGGRLRLLTKRTSRRARIDEDIVLVVYAHKDLLDIVDDEAGLSTIVAVPWAMDEIGYWIETWDPSIVGEDGEAAADEETLLVDNPVVERALSSLTSLVNLSTGLSHPSDRNRAVALFEALLEHGEDYDPDAVRAWALRNGWNTDGGDELRDVARGVAEGRQLGTGDRAEWAQGRVREWQEDADR